MSEKIMIIGSEPEIRIFQHQVEVREAGEGTQSRRIEGIAARVNSMSQVLGGWFREIIEPGAFDGADMSDVVALKNHNVDMILARTLNKTLDISVDKEGNLVYGFDAPATTTGNDTLEEVSSGLIQHSSFAFIVDDYRWETDESGNDVRRILRFKKIFDVSPVVNPAYLETESTARNMEIMMRSLEDYRKTLHPDSFAARNLMELELKIKKNRFNY